MSGQNHLILGDWFPSGTGFFVSFLLIIVLSVFLRFTASYYPFGIFKLVWNDLLSLYVDVMRSQMCFACLYD
jgi:hypothetical protein